MTVLDDITTVEPWMRPFPALEDVFEKVTDDIRELYLPAVSIEARIVDPSWTGWLHFVTPVEPFDGGLGEYSSETYENHYCRHNLIGFRRTNSGRYEPLADRMFFAINCARKRKGIFLREPGVNARETLREAEEYYAAVHASFVEARSRFVSTGQLTNVQGQPDVWFYQIGGDPNPIALQDFAPEGQPLSPDGRPFRFVGDLNTYAFRSHGSDGYYMFYDPVDEIVWFSLVFQ